ncbi:hypothetical protein NCC49_001807 [Naganishia albida]|nr:hypothetical protein NCC49_001807 [Naganishia albida]
MTRTPSAKKPPVTARETRKTTRTAGDRASGGGGTGPGRKKAASKESAASKSQSSRPSERAAQTTTRTATANRPHASLAQQPYNDFGSDDASSTWTPAIVQGLVQQDPSLTLASAFHTASGESNGRPLAPGVNSTRDDGSSATSEMDWREQYEQMKAQRDEERKQRQVADEARAAAEKRVAHVQKRAREERLLQMSKRLTPIPRPRRPRAANWHWARMEEILGLPPRTDSEDQSDVKKARVILYRWILHIARVVVDMGHRTLAVDIGELFRRLSSPTKKGMLDFVCQA